jgi:hypothetical protein
MLNSLSLGGDGDEVNAIEDVEKEFGVRLNPIEAHGWITVGDVYISLLKQLPEYATENPATWVRFCEAISRETGVDHVRVDENTKLLSPRLVDQMNDWFKGFT